MGLTRPKHFDTGEPAIVTEPGRAAQPNSKTNHLYNRKNTLRIENRESYMVNPNEKCYRLRWHREESLMNWFLDAIWGVLSVLLNIRRIDAG